MVKKILGYTLIAAGAIAVLGSYPSIRNILKINIPASPISDSALMVIGVALLIVGAVIGFRSGRSKVTEVPIYEGSGKDRRVVGYQRHSK